ncbi:MAG: helix-turn-helix domain-containing protein [Pseudomonadota bacterium]|nr:helix-turn-helix domain-containing protein [Pseudomonadota bacterium]|tara:strand:+ start:65 stop:310 length:246 start_codon:yes stop_codon:yes gene_type:complete
MSKQLEPLLHEIVRKSVEKYLGDLQGEKPSNLHGLTLSQVEKPLFEVVLEYANGNLSKASSILGINRGTLRAKLKKYRIKY